MGICDLLTRITCQFTASFISGFSPVMLKPGFEMTCFSLQMVYETFLASVGHCRNSSVCCSFYHCKEWICKTEECNRFVCSDFWEESVFNSLHPDDACVGNNPETGTVRMGSSCRGRAHHTFSTARDLVAGISRTEGSVVICVEVRHIASEFILTELLFSRYLA
jgi:hypothetical protein